MIFYVCYTWAYTENVPPKEFQGICYINGIITNDQQGALLVYCLQWKRGLKTFLVYWDASVLCSIHISSSVGYELFIQNSQNLSAQMKV